MSAWAGIDSELAREVIAQSERCLATYREDASRVEQDARIETSTAQGGYGNKQLYELIQNGADALIDGGGRIHVVLTEDCLYVANEGKDLTVAGVQSLMASHLSRKRGDEIGRFGLGFKSVVAISDNPQIFSRSGSFGFDRAAARKRIEPVVGDSPSYPMLRVAEPLDPKAEAAGDKVLKELMGWASTVIRVPLIGAHEHLRGDVDSFPAEFLLFSPQAEELRLEDRANKVNRRIKVKRKASGVVSLEDDTKKAEWRVVSRQHKPSATALADAGELARRELITVWWAVPLSSRTGVGQFWAFFPTEDRTTFAGIVNAPWKMGDDRRNLLPGRFNQEILTDVLPAIVTSEWMKLLDADDPGSILDLLPARGKEARSWADDKLNAPVIEALSRIPSIPDISGKLRKPESLRLPPKEISEIKEVGSNLLATWAGIEGVPVGWTHPSVDRTAERRLKVERLIGNRADARATVREWLEASCKGNEGVASSAVAIDIVAAITNESSALGAEARSARVVLLEDDDLAPASPGQVFLRSSPDDAGFMFIHPDLAKLPGVLRSLAVLGIRVLDRAGELRNALTGKTPEQVDWQRTWALARQCSTTVVIKTLREELGKHGAPLEALVRVRTRAGGFTSLGNAYLPGGVVSAHDSGSASICIDVEFHRADLPVLTELGAVAQPTLRAEVPFEPWLVAYGDLMKEHFRAAAAGQKPSLEKLVAEGDMPPWPLQPLTTMGEQARLATTEIVRNLAGDSWTVRHSSNASYGEKSYPNPVYLLLQKHGRLDTPFGPLRPTDCLVAGTNPFVDGDADVLPVVDLSEDDAKALTLAAGVESLGVEAWQRMAARVLGWDDVRRASRFYAWAALYIDAPDEVLAQVGRRVERHATKDVALAVTEEAFQALGEQNVPALLITDDTDATEVLNRWNLESAAQLLDQELVHEPVGEPEPLVDRFPNIRLYLTGTQFDVKLQFCDSIELVTATRDGLRSTQVPHALDNGTLLVVGDDPVKVLRAASDKLQLELGADSIRSIIEHVREQEVEELVARVRAADSDSERLALLVGAERLRRAVPASALEAIEDEIGRPMEGSELADLVGAVQGVGALQHFKAILDELNLNPPVAWAGSSKARKFVMDLGFSPDLAGFASESRPAAFSVDGPAVLGPLHDYQAYVTAKIRELLAGSGSSRAMVSLPTGAGKTRVAVQALVEAIRDDGLEGPIVWIAQSDELCEQAIDAWSYVWRAIGPQVRLTIGRLWNTNEVTEVTDGIQLVVATPNKLIERVDAPAYEWLGDATVVIVDEAHSSIAPMYTKVLEGLGRGSRGEKRQRKRPLIGLTATPFRNTSKEQTERLANRYDQNRLDAGAFESDDHYAALQERGVLARVNHKLLKGSNIVLTSAQATEIDRMSRLPSAIAEELGRDVERNRTIVDSIAGLPDDWTALLFATSVDNALALAALLTHRGIPAVAVSGSTDMSARRHYIEEFKAGRIRVITNYAVLTQGFDAPAVKAVYVTRPTFSTNVYQQMIGRGLRGPLNGGSEEVLIVNVEDNFNQFGDQLAFRDFEYLWDPEAGESGSDVSEASDPEESVASDHEAAEEESRDE